MGNFGFTRLTTVRTRGKPSPPPYSILCITLQYLHPNGFLSWDSQGGVPKLSRFGLSGLCEFITLCSDLWLGWGIKQTCSSPWELSNGVLQPHFWKSVRMTLTLPKLGAWESSGTPKTSEFDCRGQNTSPWGVLYAIGNLLKCRCRKWPCMSHLDICSTSYGKKKGRESNCQFDFRPLKVGNQPNTGQWMTRTIINIQSLHVNGHG